MKSMSHFKFGLHIVRVIFIYYPEKIKYTSILMDLYIDSINILRKGIRGGVREKTAKEEFILLMMETCTK